MRQRLFEMLYWLVGRGGATAKELAEHFEISERTVYRDIDALCAAGVPLYAEHGRGGGYKLRKDFVLDRALLTRGERQDVLAAVQSLYAAGGALDSGTVDKLSATLGAASVPWIDVDFSDWSDAHREIFVQLRQSILDRRVVEFDYYSSYGEKTHRSAEPVQLRFRSRAWYLYAYCRSAQEMRTFRLTRMDHLRVTDEGFIPSAVPPSSADSLYGTDSLHALPLLTLRIDSAMTYRVLDEFDPDQREKCADGSWIVHSRFPVDDWLLGYLQSFGPHLEVLGPPFLRSALAERLKKTLSLYEKLTDCCQDLDAILYSSQTQEDIPMEKHNPNTPFCQSCGMPLTDESLLGTEKDGAKAPDYCIYCYKDGAFTSDCTMEQMIDFCVPVLTRQMPGLPAEAARAQMNQFFPYLKRWKKN